MIVAILNGEGMGAKAPEDYENWSKHWSWYCQSGLYSTIYESLSNGVTALACAGELSTEVGVIVAKTLVVLTMLDIKKEQINGKLFGSPSGNGQFD